MKRTNFLQPQSSLDSFFYFFMMLKKKKSVETSTTIPTVIIEVTGTTELSTTTAEMSASISISTQHVEHGITETHDNMDSNSQNMNDISVVVVHDSPFSENEQISTEPATAEVAKTFSSKILNAGFINDIGKFVGTFIDDLTKKIVRIVMEAIS
ncbi:hypothetical protein HELRODRAFT_166895 [Helobdella robusta]|uniref:Uncharacterized protein n=1 Tax=Helobdella robusta TaxID=6412 RepID=T1EYQ2_HELRO|nr:hypothetical protein HELRODRAFT_166895 [Helobdella robusta]ESO11835.1 hypothetical protein HELRODRAFT_166895 [Helobdella robusta]